MHRLVTTIATLGVCALTSCASQPPPPAVTASLGGTEGSVTFTGGAVAIGIGFQWGSGTLTYQGQTVSVPSEWAISGGRWCDAGYR